MFPKFVRCSAAIFVTVISFAHGEIAQPPIDTQKLLKELDAIKAKEKQTKALQYMQLAQQFLEASKTDGTAMRLYMDAVRKVQFDSRPGGAGDFQDWRKYKKDMLDNKTFVAAVRFHLRYLAITLEAAANAKPGGLPPLPELQAYVTDYVQASKDMKWDSVRNEDQQDFLELLVKPIGSGKIARAYQVDADLLKFAPEGYDPSKLNWEPTASNWQRILEVDVRKPMRAIKDPRLIATWQFEIDAVSQGTGSRPNLDSSALQQVELPRIMWAKAQDMVLLGQQGAAIQEMVRLVRTYPQHPDLSNWIGELTTLLKAQPSSAPPAPSSPVSPAAPAARAAF